MKKSEICQSCNGKKSHQAQMCKTCRNNTKKSTSRKGLPCPDCGKPVKDWYSRRCFQCSLNYRRGSLNPNWKGGVRTEYLRDRTSDQYREWRRIVFERDKYTCQLCGDKRGGNLVAHHILTFKNFPKFRFNPNIGVTFCRPCHINVHKQKFTFWVLDYWNQGARV